MEIEKSCLNCTNVHYWKTTGQNCYPCTNFSHWKPNAQAVKQYVERCLPGETANDKQVAGKHYKEHEIQPWDYIYANNLCYFTGNCVKYVSRWKDKGGLDDLRKAIHYLEKLIELEEGKK